MEDSMAQPQGPAAVWDLPQWKMIAGAVAALLLALLFIVAGIWKITDPFSAAARMAQAKVPQVLSLPAALCFGIAETFSGILILIPRFRRWGAWLTGLMLVAFMVYIGIFYSQLRGEDCNCFPWVRRAVGPAFFIGDGIMLALAAMAGWWARKSSGFRGATIVLGAVVVFAGVSFGVNAARLSGVAAPGAILVDGKPYSLQAGKVLLFYFDPNCGHCDAAAREMAKYKWTDVKIIGVPLAMPQFGKAFMRETGLNASLTSDAEPLKKIFPYAGQPYAVYLQHGREKSMLTNFDGGEPEASLRKLGLIE